jgi:hypothetical protein
MGETLGRTKYMKTVLSQAIGEETSELKVVNMPSSESHDRSR